jgi:hypothetical protein
VLALGTGAAAVGATQLLGAEEVAVPAGVGCYAAPALDADVTVLGAAEDPVGACAEAWRAGHVDGRPRTAAPALVACTSRGEPVRVLPATPAGCRTLGLVALPEGYDALARRQAAAQDAIGPALAGNAGCRPAAAYAAAIRRALARRGLRGWRVTVAPDAGPCPSSAVDGRTRTVRVGGG